MTKSLIELAAGEQGVVEYLDMGHGFCRRLAALGFTPGGTVQVVRNHNHGPIIVSLLDTQFALGRGQATKVHVRSGGES